LYENGVKPEGNLVLVEFAAEAELAAIAELAAEAAVAEFAAVATVGAVTTVAAVVALATVGTVATVATVAELATGAAPSAATEPGARPIAKTCESPPVVQSRDKLFFRLRKKSKRCLDNNDQIWASAQEAFTTFVESNI
jgi:hypothetical protein